MKKTPRTLANRSKKEIPGFDNFGDKALSFLKSASAVEVAILGAAGFVMWKNRDKIQSYLESRGIDLSSIVSDKLGAFLQANKGSESRVTQ